MTDYEVIALFTPADGQADALHAALAGLVAPSRAEPANRGYSVRRIRATPPRYAVLERYADQSGFEAHRVAPHLTAFRERFDELLAKSPEVLSSNPRSVDAVTRLKRSPRVARTASWLRLDAPHVTRFGARTKILWMSESQASMGEDELLLAASGDADAFALYRRYAAGVLGLARRLQDPELAADVVRGDVRCRADRCPAL